MTVGERSHDRNEFRNASTGANWLIDSWLPRSRRRPWDMHGLLCRVHLGGWEPTSTDWRDSPGSDRWRGHDSWGSRGKALHELASWWANGVDPKSSGRWLRPSEHRQAVVEACSLALLLHFAKPWIWEHLSPADAGTAGRMVSGRTKSSDSRQQLDLVPDYRRDFPARSGMRI